MRVLAMGRRGEKVSRYADRAIDDYAGDVLLRVVAAADGYHLEFVLPEAGIDAVLTRVPADALLSRGYTGAYLALYAAHDDGGGVDHAEFDWLDYRPGAD